MSAVEIPGYKILKTLGVGGQATVYLAIQTGFDRKVALKVMSPALAADPTFGERFLREAKIVAKLSHKSIVTVYDVGESGNFYYLAMEYLPGDDLKNRIEKGMKARECLRIISKLARALHFAHEKGYVHRDVKSENILFNEDGEPLLTDFGIAKASNSSTQMTQTGKLIGTPEYMSPEQCRGKKIDGRSDLYSLGIILYEMLTRQVPYTGEDSVSVCIQHVTKPIPKLPQRLSHFQWLLDKLLAKDPAQRFQTGESLAEAVDKFRATGKPTEVIDTPVQAAKATKVSKKPEPSDNDEDDIFKQFANQRLVENTELTEKSHLGRNVFLIFLLLVIAAGGLTWERWLPKAKQVYANMIGNKADNAQTEVLSEKTTRHTSNSQAAEPNQSTTNLQSKLAEAEKLIAIVPHTMADLKKALALVDEILQKNPQHAPARLTRKNISAIALEEASKAAQLKDFSGANQWLSWVEFIDPQHALLGATKSNIATLKTRYDGEILAAQQSAKAIDGWLSQGDKALRENRLSAPPQNNAIYFYQQVLSKEPSNQRARDGIAKVAAKLEALMTQAIKTNQFAKARRYLQRFESLSDDLDKQQAFRNQIAAGEKSWKEKQKAIEKAKIAEQKRQQIEKERQKRLADPAIQMRLQALIDSATSLREEGALLEPPGNNAVEKYRAILKIDEKNELALGALSEIEKTLLEETITAISDGDKALAQVRLDKLRLFDEKHPQLTNLQQEIDALIEPENHSKIEAGQGTEQQSTGEMFEEKATQDVLPNKDAPQTEQAADSQQISETGSPPERTSDSTTEANPSTDSKPDTETTSDSGSATQPLPPVKEERQQ